jgi:hypothetical protein
MVAMIDIAPRRGATRLVHRRAQVVTPYRTAGYTISNGGHIQFPSWIELHGRNQLDGTIFQPLSDPRDIHTQWSMPRPTRPNLYLVGVRDGLVDFLAKIASAEPHAFAGKTSLRFQVYWGAGRADLGWAWETKPHRLDEIDLTNALEPQLLKITRTVIDHVPYAEPFNQVSWVDTPHREVRILFGFQSGDVSYFFGQRPEEVINGIIGDLELTREPEPQRGWM